MAALVLSSISPTVYAIAQTAGVDRLTHYLEIQTGVPSIGSTLVAVTAGAIVVARGLPPSALRRSVVGGGVRT